jgi:hypothetical protein
MTSFRMRGCHRIHGALELLIDAAPENLTQITGSGEPPLLLACNNVVSTTRWDFYLYISQVGSQIQV